ncbi:MAG TPA: HlyD family efflux transporter periplasmic adaptor subunit [Oscillospiraceae bacterium]|nr:HlyD family efflux transporter periplasmic adaptor subunit [Oscillospiraceae bacterium]HPK34218.1 HlyD family efflux transporter periplasmic adaptor subunit [Oscillospiraceae bacterium]HPR74879.1 HlyD family efflux transporter periplasmic adaptor subunit [Oscillospiraceae bacterium]
MSGKKRVGKRIALLLAVIFAFSAASYLYFGSRSYVKVECITPETVNRTIYVTGLGYLKEGKRTGYYFDIPVKVEQVYVKVGDEVRAGDPLLKIDLKATELTAKMAAAGIISQESNSIETVSIIDYSKKVSGDIKEILEKIPEFVYAAYDCVISGVSVQNDEYSNPYSPLVTMSDRSIICAEITVDERDAEALEIGQQAIISGSALTGDYVAIVTSVAARATMSGTDATTSSKVDVRLELSGADDSLVINSLVRADISIGTVENLLIIPYEAVFFSDESDYVYINQNGIASKINVKTGRAFDDGIEIVTGISTGDKLIVSSKSELTDGCSIKE